MSELRLIIDPPRPGAWNMAVDEVLLEQAAEAGLATLRIYQWSEPTLSLGYFQNYAEREQHAASRGCAVVRRQSGGGAIVHDRELTYSISLPGIHPLAQETSELYRQVHGALIELLQPHAAARQGQMLRIFQEEEVAPAENRAFLCFKRRAAGDVVLGDGKIEETVKVAGSAQRRRQSAVLQHGSILLERSPAAPELPGLRDRFDLPFSEERLAEDIAGRLSQILGDSTTRADVAIERKARVEQLVADKYGRRPGQNGVKRPEDGIRRNEWESLSERTIPVVRPGKPAAYRPGGRIGPQQITHSNLAGLDVRSYAIRR